MQRDTTRSHHCISIGDAARRRSVGPRAARPQRATGPRGATCAFTTRVTCASPQAARSRRRARRVCDPRRAQPAGSTRLARIRSARPKPRASSTADASATTIRQDAAALRATRRRRARLLAATRAVAHRHGGRIAVRTPLRTELFVWLSANAAAATGDQTKDARRTMAEPSQRPHRHEPQARSTQTTRRGARAARGHASRDARTERELRRRRSGRSCPRLPPAA